MTVNDILVALDRFAPFNTALPDDTVGLLVGRGGNEVACALAALDLTSESVAEAEAFGAQLIITHHPLYLQGNALNDRTPEGVLALMLAERGIALIAMHTNLDAARGGVNDVLAQRAGLLDAQPFDRYNAGRKSALAAPVALRDYADMLKQALGCGAVGVMDAGRPVQTVAVCGGAGNILLQDVLVCGCDTFVTGELKYPNLLAARERGVNVLLCGHFETENIICPVITELLSTSGVETRISAARCAVSYV